MNESSTYRRDIPVPGQDARYIKTKHEESDRRKDIRKRAES